MKRRSPVVVAALVFLPWLSSAGYADDYGDVGTPLTSGDVGINLRARYEGVDQANIPDRADAITARLRLNYSTGEWNKLSGFAEYDYLFHLLSDFNSGAGTSPAKGRFPVVADPKGSDLNQLYVDYNFDTASRLRIGRQRILIDNQRFVGGVGWRQNEQTYDAATFSSTAIEKMDFSYSVVGYVRRIFGERVVAGKNNVDAHLLNAKIVITDAWSITPYYYRIENQDVATFSTATAGARLAGKITVGDNKIAVIAEFATQSDIANNPVSYDAEYTLVSAMVSTSKDLSIGLTYESLGGASAPGMAFRTPLATLHAFQGWADRFLATPAAGIDDVFATVRYKAGDWNLTGIYHDFSAETGSADYGTEFDVSLSHRISDNYSILLKAAFFSGDLPTMPDTDKIWIMVTANY